MKLNLSSLCPLSLLDFRLGQFEGIWGLKGLRWIVISRYPLAAMARNWRWWFKEAQSTIHTKISQPIIASLITFTCTSHVEAERVAGLLRASLPFVCQSAAQTDTMDMCFSATKTKNLNKTVKRKQHKWSKTTKKQRWTNEPLWSRAECNRCENNENTATYNNKNNVNTNNNITKANTTRKMNNERTGLRSIWFRSLRGRLDTPTFALHITKQQKQHNPLVNKKKTNKTTKTRQNETLNDFRTLCEQTGRDFAVCLLCFRFWFGFLLYFGYNCGLCFCLFAYLRLLFFCFCFNCRRRRCWRCFAFRFGLQCYTTNQTTNKNPRKSKQKQPDRKRTFNKASNAFGIAFRNHDTRNCLHNTTHIHSHKDTAKTNEQTEKQNKTNHIAALFCIVAHRVRPLTVRLRNNNATTTWTCLLSWKKQQQHKRRNQTARPQHMNSKIGAESNNTKHNANITSK